MKITEDNYKEALPFLISASIMVGFIVGFALAIAGIEFNIIEIK